MKNFQAGCIDNEIAIVGDETFALLWLSAECAQAAHDERLLGAIGSDDQRAARLRSARDLDGGVAQPERVAAWLGVG